MGVQERHDFHIIEKRVGGFEVDVSQVLHVNGPLVSPPRNSHHCGVVTFIIQILINSTETLWPDRPTVCSLVYQQVDLFSW